MTKFGHFQLAEFSNFKALAKDQVENYRNPLVIDGESIFPG
jgi:hypothetical protein